MAKHWIYNGSPVTFPHSSGKKFDKFIADNEHLVGSECSVAEYAVAIGVIETEEKRHKRKQAYANGDYIDAIMKQLNYDRLQGKELIQEMDDKLTHWIKVKQDFPV